MRTRDTKTGVPLPDDLLTAELVADPYPAFQRLRAEDPIHWSDRHRSWVITRFDDVWSGLRDSRLSSDRISPFLERLSHSDRTRLDPVFDVLSRWMVFRDPPSHTRLRKLVSKAFTVRSVQSMQPDVKRLVDELLDDLEEEETIDLLDRFAFPLPAIVIARMLGVPPDERDLFKRWSDELTSLVFGATDVADRHERAHQGMKELANYLRNLIAHYRDHPAPNLITALAEAEEQGDNLSMDEVVATCALLLFGGHETTTNLIGNGVLALAGHAEQRDALRADVSLLPQAIEEILRFDGPAKIAVRTVLVQHELRGRRLQVGERVFLALAAANRDPEEFPDPDRFDISRTQMSHLGFGFGLHYCLGASLARMEGFVALDALHTRYPNIQVATEELRWHPTLLSRGLESLPVTLGPRLRQGKQRGKRSAPRGR